MTSLSSAEKRQAAKAAAGAHRPTHAPLDSIRRAAAKFLIYHSENGSDTAEVNAVERAVKKELFIVKVKQLGVKSFRRALADDDLFELFPVRGGGAYVMLRVDELLETVQQPTLYRNATTATPPHPGLPAVAPVKEESGPIGAISKQNIVEPTSAGTLPARSTSKQAVAGTPTSPTEYELLLDHCEAQGTFDYLLMQYNNSNSASNPSGDVPSSEAEGSQTLLKVVPNRYAGCGQSNRMLQQAEPGSAAAVETFVSAWLQACRHSAVADVEILCLLLCSLREVVLGHWQPSSGPCLVEFAMDTKRNVLLKMSDQTIIEVPQVVQDMSKVVRQAALGKLQADLGLQKTLS